MKEFLKELFEIVPQEVACAIITLIGVLFANIISRRISKSTIEKEIEKLERTWKHDETTTSEQAYREMVDAVSKYVTDSSVTNQNAARTKVALMLSFADGEMVDALKSLYDALKRRPSPDAEAKLMAVIMYRKELQIAREKNKSFFRRLKDRFFS